MGGLILLASVPAIGIDFPHNLLWVIYYAVIFCVGVELSLTMYRAMLGQATGTFRQLAHANLSVYFAYLFVSVFVGFFLLILPGILLEAAGFEGLSDETDPAVVIAALRDLLKTPYGWVLMAVTMVGLGFLSWFALRLTIYGAATVTRGETMIFQTWPWTKGHAVSLGLASVVTHVLPFLFATGVSTLIPENQSLLRACAGALLLYPFFLLGHGLALAAYERLKPVAPTE